MGAFLSALSFLVYIMGLNLYTVSPMGKTKQKNPLFVLPWGGWEGGAPRGGL